MNTLKNKLLLALVFLAIFSLQSKAQDSIQKTKMLSLERVGIGFQKAYEDSYLTSLLNPLATKIDLDFSVFNKINLRTSWSVFNYSNVEVSEVINPYHSNPPFLNHFGESRNTTVKSLGLGTFFSVFDRSRFNDKINLQIGISFSYLDVFMMKEQAVYAFELYDKNEYFPFFQLNYMKASVMGMEFFTELFYKVSNHWLIGITAGHNATLFGRINDVGGQWSLYYGDNYRFYDHFYYGIALRYLLK